LAEALIRLESGDALGAEALLHGLKGSQAQKLRARLACARGQHLEAIKLLRAGAFEQESAEQHVLLGTCWQHLTQWESAEKALRRAVLLDPARTEAFVLLGTTLYQQERHREAVQAMERALSIDSRALLARYHLAQICMELGDFKRALSQLHILRSLKPDDAPVHRLQAAIFLQVKDFRQALVELCWLVEAGHADTWCFSTMGGAYRAIGENVQALKAYEYALKLDATLSDESAFAAQLNEELGQFEAALRGYRTLRRDLTWGERARAAVERLESHLAVLPLSANPAVDLPDFQGFQPPPVSKQGNLPLERESRVGTPIGMAEVGYEGPPPILERLKRNLAELAERLGLKARSQEVLDRIAPATVKEGVAVALRKFPLKRFFGDRKP